MTDLIKSKYKKNLNNNQNLFNEFREPEIIEKMICKSFIFYFLFFTIINTFYFFGLFFIIYEFKKYTNNSILNNYEDTNNFLNKFNYIIKNFCINNTIQC